MAKLRLLTSVAVMVAMLMAALPATAFAHSGNAVSCSLVLGISDPGTDKVKVKGNHIQIKNSGQVAQGWVDCGDITFDEDGAYIPGAPIHPLDGYVMTDHGSKVKLDPVADVFKGKLKGALTLVTLLDPDNPLTGKLKAKVSGAGLFAAWSGSPAGLVETIDGEWELKGKDIKAEGELSIGLAFNGFTLVGAGALSGDLELEDEGEDDDDEDDDDEDDDDEDDDDEDDD